MVIFFVYQLMAENNCHVQQIFHYEDHNCWVLVIFDQLVGEIKNVCNDQNQMNLKNNSCLVLPPAIVEDHATNNLHEPHQEGQQTDDVASPVLPGFWYVCTDCFVSHLSF
jgi:hypothetical protein